HAAKGERKAARGQTAKVRGVNVQVQCGEFRRKQVLGMQPREVNQRKVGRKCDMLGIGHRIIRNRLSDKLTRRRIKQLVSRVQNPLELRNIDALEIRDLLDLAIHERAIVAPGSVKQLVAFY